MYRVIAQVRVLLVINRVHNASGALTLSVLHAMIPINCLPILESETTIEHMMKRVIRVYAPRDIGKTAH